MTELAALLVGLALGAALRPLVGRLRRRLSPRPRPDSAEQSWRRDQHRALETDGEVDAVAFWGDSILHAMELGEWFPRAELRLLNRAISGDRTEHLLARVEESRMRVERCVLLVGANDVLHEGVDRAPEEIAERVLRIAELLRARSARPPVVVALLPTGSAAANDAIEAVNARLRAAPDLELVDPWPELARDGRMAAEHTVDGVHLGPSGMARLAACLARALPELGPPVRSRSAAPGPR